MNKSLISQAVLSAISALGQYRLQGCICHAFEGEQLRIEPGCPMHWPNAPQTVVRRDLVDGCTTADRMG